MFTLFAYLLSNLHLTHTSQIINHPFDIYTIFLFLPNFCAIYFYKKTQLKRNYSFFTITILRFSFKKGTFTSCTMIETTFFISFNSASGF